MKNRQENYDNIANFIEQSGKLSIKYVSRLLKYKTYNTILKINTIILILHKILFTFSNT